MLRKIGRGGAVKSNIMTGGGVSAPVNSVAPVASGTNEVGETLSVTNGTWTNSPSAYSYQWRRDAANIGGATSSTYTLVSADAETDIDCVVTASNAGGSDSADSNDITIAAAEDNAAPTSVAMIGNSGAMDSNAYHYFAAVGGDNIALKSNGDLEYWAWDGSDWSQVGNTLASGALQSLGLVPLGAGRVGLITGTVIKPYTWDGSDWNATTGEDYAIGSSAVAYDHGTRIPGGDIFFVHGGVLQQLAYEAGVGFTTVGDPVDISNAGQVSVSSAGLTTNRFASYDADTEEVFIYEKSGDTWSEVASLTVSTAAGHYQMARVNDAHFMLLNGDDIKSFAYNGSDTITELTGLKLDDPDSWLSSYPQSMCNFGDDGDLFVAGGYAATKFGTIQVGFD